MTSRCLLLVHAHPDDESIFTGATMAKYAAEGTRVALVTCTRGELGSIRRNHPAAQVGDLPPGEGRMAMIADLRAKELEAACAELGVTEHWYLGGPGRWRDSGPRGHDDPRSFCYAKLDEAAGELAALVHRVRPQVMVTYDANGFYRHPDHIQAHRVAWRAYQRVCDPLRTKFYALTMPRSVLADAINEARQSWPAGQRPAERGRPTRISIFNYHIRNIDDAGWSHVCEELAPAFAAVPGLVSKVWLHGEADARGELYLWEDRAAYEAFLASDLGKTIRSHPNVADLTMRDYAIDEALTRVTQGGPTRATPDAFLQFGVPDDQVSTEICANSFLDAKIAALKAHATQIIVNGPFFDAGDLVRMRILGTEYYTLLSHSGAIAGGNGGRQRENDLFCGI